MRFFKFSIIIIKGGLFIKTPVVSIDINKLSYNARFLKEFYKSKGIEIVAVLKGVSGNTTIAKIIHEQGISILSDTNVQNLKKFKELSKGIQCMMMRTPAKSEIEDVVSYTDISLNTEIDIIKLLSDESKRQGKIHQIILMIELGDLREGILPKNLMAYITRILTFENVEIVGIGTNFACFNNQNPSDEAMKHLSDLGHQIEFLFNLKLKYISGGNSTMYSWVKNTKDTYRINQVRLGESILCGTNPLDNLPIEGMHQDVFELFTEVIEAKQKGKQVVQNSYLKRLILNIGRQDTDVSGLTSNNHVEIVNFSSNHIAAITKDETIGLGSRISFRMNYESMMSSMTSPNVYKSYK